MFRFFLSLVLVFQGMAFAAPREEIVNVRAEYLFVPVGFDDNDEVVAVLDGYLPDPCHKLVPADVKTDIANMTVSVQQKARLFTGVCPDVIVPYTVVVRLGNLPEGNFTVVTNGGSLKENVAVKQSANPGPDDYLYAPIDAARVEYLPGGKRKAVLEGRFTDSCLRIDELKVVNSEKTIEVLPILKRLTQEEGGGKCRRVESPFKVAVDLPELSQKYWRYLLHVRSLNGQSLNVVFHRTAPNR